MTGFLKSFGAFLGMSMLLASAPSTAETDILSLGPQVGDVIPHDLSATDHSGAATSLDSLTGEEGLVLIFVRSVDWCPFCQTQVLDWNGQAEKFTALGYNVAALSYDNEEKANKFVKQRDLKFPVVTDPDSTIIKAFGILNEQHEPGTFAYGIAHPFVYVVAPDGTITHRFAEQNYRNRPPVPEVLDALSGQS